MSGSGAAQRDALRVLEAWEPAAAQGGGSSGSARWALIIDGDVGISEGLYLYVRHFLAAFDAEADAALMHYHPHVRNSLAPTAFARATTLLPMRWVGRPPPYELCVRLGELDVDEVRRASHGARPSSAARRATACTGIGPGWKAKAADGTFDTPSLDFRDNLLLIGSYRPFHNLQVWDIRQLNAPVMTTDVGWNRVAAPSKGLGKWKLAKARFVNVCNVLACQWNGDELIAGGTGRTANEVKLFRNEGTSEEPSYQPYKVFKAPPGLLGLPSGVLGFHYSSKKDRLAVATKTGKVFGVQVGNK